MERVQGVVFGDTSANVGEGDVASLEAACLHALRDFAGPIAMGLRCGHVTGGNRSLLLGAEAELRCADEAVLTVFGEQETAAELEGEDAWQSTSI